MFAKGHSRHFPRLLIAGNGVLNLDDRLDADTDASIIDVARGMHAPGLARRAVSPSIPNRLSFQWHEAC